MPSQYDVEIVYILLIPLNGAVAVVENADWGAALLPADNVVRDLRSMG